MWTVTGEVVFEDEPQPFSGATAYIYLEDVSRVDAPARVVVTSVVSGLSYRPHVRPSVKIDLQTEPQDPRGTYAVRAHIDVDGDGRLSAGDYVSVESYPVLTRGNPTEVTVRVRRAHSP